MSTNNLNNDYEGESVKKQKRTLTNMQLNYVPDNHCYEDEFDNVAQKQQDDVVKKQQLNKIMAICTINEQLVIKYLFNDLLTEEETGKLMSICHQRVSQLKYQVLNKIKKLTEQGIL